MMVAKDIMSFPVTTIKRDATIEEAAKILYQGNISGAPVVDENGNVIGIISEKDLIYKEIEPSFPAYVEKAGVCYVDNYEDNFRKFFSEKAEEIMTKEVIIISEDTNTKEIAEIMVTKRIKRLPVMNDGKLIGIVSRADIVKTLMY